MCEKIQPYSQTGGTIRKVHIARKRKFPNRSDELHWCETLFPRCDDGWPENLMDRPMKENDISGVCTVGYLCPMDEASPTLKKIPTRGRRLYHAVQTDHYSST